MLVIIFFFNITTRKYCVHVHGKRTRRNWHVYQYAIVMTFGCYLRIISFFVQKGF